MEKNKIVSLVKLAILLTGIVLSLLSIALAFTVYEQREAYFKEEKIYFEEFSVKMEDGVILRGFLYVDKDLQEKRDNSVPTILLIHGINGRKESNFDKAFQLVKLGYAVFSMEQRGHGDSGGLSGFIGKEPHDMVESIDFIEKEYKFANVNDIGVLAFSYGGGVALVLQAIDERVYASVIYHPLSNIDELSEQIPFERLIGKTPAIPDAGEIEDGKDACTPKNTKNLLLIQGEEDDLITPEMTEDLYKQLNGSKRDDIDLELRPGLDHGENEADETSFKHALVWLEHFYHDSSINITDRESAVDNIELFDFNYPSSATPELLTLLGALFLGVAIILVLVPKKIWPINKENLSQANNTNSNPNPTERDQNYKKMILYRSILYLVPTVIGALSFSIFNPSYIYGYFLAISLATLVLMLFVPSYNKSSWREEWTSWYKNDRTIFGYGLIMIAIPILLYIMVFNLNAYITKSSDIPFFTTTTLLYLAMVFGLLLADWSYIRSFKLKHTILLLAMRPFTLLIFFLFIPIPPFLYFGDEMFYIIILISIGALFWSLLLIIEIPRLIFKNRFIAMAVIFLPVLVFLSYRFFRII